MYPQVNQTGGTRALATGDCASRPEGQIEAQHRYLGEALSRLSEGLSQLDARLQPVMRPCAPATDRKEPLQEAFVAVAQRTNDAARQVQALCDHVTDLLQRLET